MAICNRSLLLVTAGFCAGAAIFSGGFVFASSTGATDEPSAAVYLVSLDEIKQSFVKGETFSRAFTKKVTMSDGSRREVTLRPVRKNGQELVELTDKSDKGVFHGYMGPNGTTTDGTLMVNVKDMAGLEAAMRKSGASRN